MTVGELKKILDRYKENLKVYIDDKEVDLFRISIEIPSDGITTKEQYNDDIDFGLKSQL